jgi:serine/threonine protein kinase
MPICSVCQTEYPQGTTSCSKDGTLLSDENDDGLSTLEEGLNASQLLQDTPNVLKSSTPPQEPPGKFSAANLKVAVAVNPPPSVEEIAPLQRKKTGPVVIVKTSNEDSNELIKAETLFAKEVDPKLKALSLPETPSFAEKTKEEEEEDGGVSTLEEPLTPFDRYIGTVINNHKIEKKLGQGGMGAVYLANHFTLGRKVAIKILKQEFVSKQDVVRRFFDEARASNKIKHPNIVEVYDVGILPDRSAYLVMELLEGSDLKSILKQRGALPPEEVQSLFIPICDALQAAHDVGIVHRDLKPENLFICKENGKDFPKVVDFGIAKLSDNALDVQLKTRTGMVMGTPAYMSPEQAAGQKTLDARADIYSIGVILYECLTGRPPFQGESVAALLIKQVTEMPNPVREIAPDKHIPPKLNDLVQRCLEKDPAARPQTIAEVANELRNPNTFVSSGTVEAVHLPAVKAPPTQPAPNIGERANTTKITRIKDEPKEATPEAPPKNNQWMWGVAGVAFAGVLFWGIWSLVADKPVPPPKPSASQEIELPTPQFAAPPARGFMHSGKEILLPK